MYQIKQQPEDFIVKEISTVQLGIEGKYSYFLMKKRNYNTFEAVQQIADLLRIPPKKIGYAGNKDKKAVTEQMISIEGIPKERIEQIKTNNMQMKDLSLEYKGSGNTRICLGDLKGNAFEITARNIDKKPKLKKKFINYFGEQRFSTNNAEIGKAIVMKDFKKAVELILCGTGRAEERMQEYLGKNTNNYVGALKTTHKKILILYIHAYQSLLWNRTVQKHSSEKNEMTEVPIIGFGIATPDKCTDELMQSEGIKPRDFVIKQIPELSSEGATRQAVAEASEVSVSKLEDDELNPGMKKTTIKFILPKGSYATEYVKQLFIA